MGTIIDYIKEYGDYTFREKPLCEVDSLILCQFAYLKFEGLVPDIREDTEAVDIQYLLDNKDDEVLFYATEWYRKRNAELFLAMANSKRFGTLKVKDYVNQVEVERESQFSAITCRLGDGTYYIAYRGTDESMIGWKEDLNLAFSEPVPGQVMAVDYLNRAAEKIGQTFYIGGHSKGGNLAVYAAMNCEKPIQDRIIAIFNHDSPGFRPEVKEKCGYDKIESKIRRTVPRSSLVGMLLDSEGSYRVVGSKSIGLAQHDPYSWRVEKDDFQIVEHVYSHTMFMDSTLNDWILSLNQEQMHIFIDTLFDVIQASEADNLIDFLANWKRSIQGIMAAVKNVDADALAVMNDIMKALFDMLSQHAKEELQSKYLKNKT